MYFNYTYKGVQSMASLGLIGYGTIGRYIYNELSKEGHNFSFIYDRRPLDKNEKLLDNKTRYLTTQESLTESLLQKTDLVIECAHASIVKKLAPIIIQSTSLILFSLTAFSDETFLNYFIKTTEGANNHFYIPHGAILGLDGIFDGRHIIESVEIKTTKRPSNLGLTNQTREIIFKGSTREACKYFPRNVNVHAAIALAGIGFDETISTIISDPESEGNLHQIEIILDGCRFNIEICSTPGSGVTGAYTPISAVASIKRIIDNDIYTVV